MSLEGELVSRYAEARRNLWNPQPKQIKRPPLKRPALEHMKSLLDHASDTLPRSKFTIRPADSVIEMSKTIPPYDLDAMDDEPMLLKMTNWKQIAKEVLAKHKGVGMADILSGRRNRVIVLARNEMFWRCRNETTLSYPQIGRKFNKDHTTVLWGVRQHQRIVDGLPPLKRFDPKMSVERPLAQAVEKME